MTRTSSAAAAVAAIERMVEAGQGRMGDLAGGASTIEVGQAVASRV